MEKRDGTEIRMGTNSHSSRCGIGRVPGAPRLAAAHIVYRVPLHDFTWWKTELIIESIEHDFVDFHALRNIWDDSRFHARIDRGGVCSMDLLWPGYNVIPGDVEELYGVQSSDSINGPEASGFVSALNLSNSS